MRVLSFILAWLFVCQPESAKSQTQLTKDKETLAVLSRYTQKNLPADLNNMVETITEALSESKHYTLVPTQTSLKNLIQQGAIGPVDTDLDKLKGRFQTGYIQSYEFRYTEAVQTLNQVITKLHSAPDQPERWTLYIESLIHLARSHLGLRQIADAKASFMQVLKSRPNMQLSSKNHPPKIIHLFKAAKKELARLSKTNLMIQTDPSQAEVYLDGLQVGKTPYQAQHAQGTYLLTIKHKTTGSISRRIQLDKLTIQIGIKLGFEAALDISKGQLGIRTQEGKNMPTAWWGWLSDRLRVNRAAVISKQHVENRPRWVASLVDLQTGRTVREGWLEPTPNKSMQDALDLAHFLEAGTSQRVIQSLPKKNELVKQSETAPKKKPKGALEQLAADSKPPVRNQGKQPNISSSTTTANSLHLSEKPPRPLGRTWWPYVLTSAVMGGVGIAAHITASNLGDSGGLADRSSAHKTWMGVAIGSYVAAGILSIFGITLHYTFNPQPNHRPRHSLQPRLGNHSLGLLWTINY